MEVKVRLIFQRHYHSPLEITLTYTKTLFIYKCFHWTLHKKSPTGIG